MSAARALYKVLWVYSYLAAALVTGIALLPAYFFFEYVTGLDAALGVSLRGADAPWPGELLRAFLVTTTIAIDYYLFGLALILVMGLVRPLLGRSREGEMPLFSLGAWQFYNYDGLLLFFSVVYATFLRSTSLYPVYLRLMGAKIGRNVIVNTTKIYDHDLLRIGDNTVIGGDAIIIAHIVEGRRLIRRRVTIGRNVTIGQYASVFPGATIEDDVTVGAHAVVRKGAFLPRGTVWGGVPARQIARKKSPSAAARPRRGAGSRARSR